MLNGHTPQNTTFVADFDRTITSGEPGGLNAFGAFPRTPGSSESFQEEATKLYNYYYPIETDPDISDEERAIHMKQWNEKVYELLGECVDQDQFERVLEYAKKNIKIRGGLREGLQEIGGMGIPLIVFSAGVANIIEEVLGHHGIPYHGVHSNRLGFPSNTLELINQGVYVGHKGWSSLPPEIMNGVSTRSHQIILGDSIDDLNMGDPTKTRTSIGFLITDKVEKGETENYHRAFNHVVQSDMSDEGIMRRVIQELKQAA